MSKRDEEFSLLQFEDLVYSRQHELAANQLLTLLDHLEKHRGELDSLGSAPSGTFSSERRDVYFASRIAAATTALFADPEFTFSEIGFGEFIRFQRFFPVIFGASPFKTADHVLRLLDSSQTGGHLTIEGARFFKFCLLYSLDSDIPLDPEQLWALNRRFAVGLLLTLLSTKVVATPTAYERRSRLLEWIPSRLALMSLEEIPFQLLHHVWMYCSYADSPDKHQIKVPINKLARATLVNAGILDLESAPASPRAKPVLLCIVEWFGTFSSVYRTHSLSLEALRTRYHVIGISLRGESDAKSREVFDEVHVIPAEQPILETVQQVRALAAKLQPAIVYYLSVGMFLETIFLANVRLAEIQMAGLGHSATTHCPSIDYFLVEEDYVGDPASFSERVVALPRDSSPYRRLAPAEGPRASTQGLPGKARVAVTASLMKFNPVFLNALKRIRDQSTAEIEFHFFPGAAYGLFKVYLERVIQDALGISAVVYPQLPYEVYLDRLSECAFFVNPFPFGNMNGNIDAAMKGVPGVCWSGPEVHAHIDAGMFRRLGLPEWLIAHSQDEYVAAAVRLADDTKVRHELSSYLLSNEAVSQLFEGNAQKFTSTIDWLRIHHKAFGSQKLLVPDLGETNEETV